MKYQDFLRITVQLNKELQIKPLLFGSLGLERRLGKDLHADDIDILIPERFLNSDWDKLLSLMNGEGWQLYDEEEHAFEKGGICAAFASLENLVPFADVDISAIPTVNDGGAQYLLLTLEDYLKVYQASSKDGYRRDIKNKQDSAKIELIKMALNKNNT